MRFVARPVATVRVPPRVWRIPFPSIFFSFAGLELTFSGIKLVTTQPLIAAALRLLDSKRQRIAFIGRCRDASQVHRCWSAADKPVGLNRRPGQWQE